MQFSTVNAGGAKDVNRDRWGRPLLVPPGGGKPQPYTRVTTIAGTLEDRRNLEQWSQRMVALGLNARKDLQALVAANADDKQRLNAICEDAVEAAKASASANMGTAIHTFTERVDLGLPLGDIPDAIHSTLVAYLQLRKRLSVEVEQVEAFCAHPQLKYAGTTDRIITMNGARYIADIKTGNIDFGQQSIAAQLAMYAHAQHYDIAADEWGGPLDVSKETAYVIHLPQDTAAATLHAVDIASGWRAAQLSLWTREWRKSKPVGPAL